MTRPRKAIPQFAICIRSDDSDMLTPRMLYQVLPDELATRVNYVRVIDNEGEDYLYPADYFVFVDLPRVLERTLRRIAFPPARKTPTERPLATMRQRHVKHKPA
jgi:hypothetical protein